MLTMRMSYELDQLLGTYADWIAWLKEKEASLEVQLTRMKGRGEKQATESSTRAPVTEGSPVEVSPALADEVPEEVFVSLETESESPEAITIVMEAPVEAPLTPVEEDDSTPQGSDGGSIPDNTGETLSPGEDTEDDWL